MSDKLYVFHPKDPNRETHELDWTPENQQKAEAKGYQVAIPMAHPSDPEDRTFYIPAERIKDAEGKGYKWRSTLDMERKIDKESRERLKGKLQGGKGKAISAMKGFADVGTFGFSDEIVGAVGAMEDAIKKGSLEGFKEAYKRYRDYDRKLTEVSEKENPWSARAGKAIAIGASMLGAAPAAAAKGATTMGQVMKEGAKAGGAMGALGGAGGSTADLTEGEWLKFGKDVGAGGLVGAGLGAGFSAGGKYLGDKIAKGSAKKAEEAVGVGRTPTQRKNLIKQGYKEGEKGAELIEQGAIKAGDTVEDVFERAIAKQEETGNKISKILKDLPEDQWRKFMETAEDIGGGVRVAEIPKGMKPLNKSVADDMRQAAADMARNPAQRKLAKKLLQEAKEFDNLKDLSPAELHNIKVAYDSKINWAARNQKQAEAERAFRNVINSALERGAEVTGKLPGYKAAKQGYGAASDLAEAALQRQAAKDPSLISTGEVLQNIAMSSPAYFNPLLAIPAGVRQGVQTTGRLMSRDPGLAARGYKAGQMMSREAPRVGPQASRATREDLEEYLNRLMEQRKKKGK